MKWIVVGSVLGLLLGCASVEVEKLTDGNRATAKGIRFWRPALYLAVSAEKDGASSGKLIYLPDPREEYIMRETAGFGSASVKPTLTDGWNLTALDSSVDSKAADVLGVFAKLVTPAKAGTREAKQKRFDISPGLYRIKMDSQNGSLFLDMSGVYEVGPICATLKSPSADGAKEGSGQGGN